MSDIKLTYTDPAQHVEMNTTATGVAELCHTINRDKGTLAAMCRAIWDIESDNIREGFIRAVVWSIGPGNQKSEDEALAANYAAFNTVKSSLNRPGTRPEDCKVKITRNHVKNGPRDYDYSKLDSVTVEFQHVAQDVPIAGDGSGAGNPEVGIVAGVASNSAFDGAFEALNKGGVSVPEFVDWCILNGYLGPAGVAELRTLLAATADMMQADVETVATGTGG